MNRISDALELLTAQHDELQRLLAELGSASPDARPKVFGMLADKLITHLAAEQELFYPSIAVAAKADVVAAHDQMKRLVADLLWRELDDEAPRLAQLTALIERHVLDQEPLFMAVAEAMPTGVLRGMGDQLRAWSESSLCIAA